MDRSLDAAIHLNPLLLREKAIDEPNLTFAHEVFHCFEFMDYPTFGDLRSGAKVAHRRRGGVGWLHACPVS